MEPLFLAPLYRICLNMESTKTQSFAANVKDEVTSFYRDDESKRALLSSFIKINGHVKISEGKEILECRSEKASIAKLIYQYLHELYGVNVRFAYLRSAGFLKRINYLVVVTEEASDILNDLGIDLLADRLPKTIVATEEQGASFLAGAFLAAGSVNDPKSTSYHLEIALFDEAYARWLSKIWNKVVSHSFHSKVVKRRSEWIVYLKRSDEISDFLILIGAKESCLYFENVRIDRDFANQTNRLNNLDTANMGKTVKTSERQIEEIEYLKKHGGLEPFSNQKLSLLCDFRLRYPDASYEELSVHLSEELATTITKSNINHLFRFLHNAYLEAKGHE